jgi:hypothetical protein
MHAAKQVLSLRDRHSFIHTMFWAIVAIVAGMVAAFAAVLAGADPGPVGVAAQLWPVAVLCASFAAAAVTGDMRIISSDRLVERIVARSAARMSRDEEEE